MFDLNEKVALVTGASRGLGKAIAKALHDQGAFVVLSGRNEESLEEVRNEIGQERTFIIPADLGNPDDVASLVPRVEAEKGRLDILVNNAGLTRDNLMMRMKDEDWDDVLRVNLSAAFALSRGSIRGMMKKRFGRIINITSVVGVTGNPGQANYCAAKAGIIGMSKSIAAEVASRGITVNCVAPGFMKSAMTDALNSKQQETILQSIPQGKMGTPEDIAAAVVYLASSEAGYVTGQTLHVNGGMAMV